MPRGPSKAFQKLYTGSLSHGGKALINRDTAAAFCLRPHSGATVSEERSLLTSPATPYTLFFAPRAHGKHKNRKYVTIRIGQGDKSGESVTYAVSICVSTGLAFDSKSSNSTQRESSN
uniref:Uncharacterized protein n=1 Tax=Steinernema glaseri TaxID=37863 RepID=A0A1I7YQ63_9BILA